MTTLTENSLAGETTFARQKEWAPEWVIPLKNKAWEEFQTLPAPKRSDEDWRFSGLRGLGLDQFRPASAAGDSSSHPWLQGVKGIKISIVNDQFDAAGSSLPSSLPNGVLIGSWQNLWESHRKQLEPLLYQDRPNLGSDKLAALHHALQRNGAVVLLEDGAILEEPIFISYTLTEEGAATFPYTVIAAGKGARCNVVESFYSPPEIGPAFACGMTHLVAGDHSEVSYLGIQQWNLASTGFQLNSVEAGQEARVRNLVLQLGSRYARHENHSKILGAKAHVDMFSATVAGGEQELDQRTLQDHCAPGAVSDLLYKNVLGGLARTIFSGLIKVEPDAQQTDAYQTNRNLLLNETAEAVSMPGLEILANDVKCSHGATSGQIDDSELFYMLARGITPAKARELLVAGFLGELLERIEDKPCQELAQSLVSQQLARISQ